MHTPVHEVRDAVYGFVKLTKAEWAIVNSRSFQRLRNIRQLGMAHMVYPGATHTRFEHSIGCVHLATTILDHLWGMCKDQFSEFGITNTEDLGRAKRILRVGALLHDIGHPPFSHTAEKALLPTDEYNEVQTELNHEHMSATILRSEEISSLIHEQFRGMKIVPEEVIAVATKPDLALVGNDARTDAMYSFLNAILTSDLGADRMDYLLRDARHTGQPTGMFDYQRLVDTMTLVGPGEEDQPPHATLGLTEQGWLTAEQMIVARYLMYLTVYFHKTKCIYEHHMTEFLQAWLEGGALPIAVDDYLRLDDNVVLTAASTVARDPCALGHEAAKRLVLGRSHWRLAHEVLLADCYKDDGGRRTPDVGKFDKFAAAVKKKYADNVHFDKISHSATKMFEPKGKIRVKLSGRTRYLDELSEIVRGMSANIWRGRVYCEAKNRDEVKQWCQRWFDDHRQCERER